MRLVDHLARSVLAAVICASPIEEILLATERRRAGAQGSLSPDACLWSSLASVCLRRAA